MEDVQNLENKELEDLIDLVEGFNLIIGGSPCNNLTGNNSLSPISHLVVRHDSGVAGYDAGAA